VVTNSIWIAICNVSGNFSCRDDPGPILLQAITRPILDLLNK